MLAITTPTFSTTNLCSKSKIRITCLRTLLTSRSLRKFAAKRLAGSFDRTDDDIESGRMERPREAREGNQ